MPLKLPAPDFGTAEQAEPNGWEASAAPAEAPPEVIGDELVDEPAGELPAEVDDESPPLLLHAVRPTVAARSAPAAAKAVLGNMTTLL